MSKDSTFNTNASMATASVYGELRHGGVTNPINSYTVPGTAPLEPATTCYWHVRPRVQGDGFLVDWLDTRSFTTP